MSTKRVLLLIVLFSLIVLTSLGALAAADTVQETAAKAASQGAMPDWSVYGDQSGSQYGESVRSAGDVNGDGYDDAIVGAWQYDNGAYDKSGRAYLYYGSATGLSLTPDWEASPPVLNANGFFGGMAASAGDVNGDEYDDVMISMVNYDNAFTDEGAVFVWYGSETGLGTNYDWMARGNATYAHFGWGLGTAGDVDEDGYDDIIVGALRYDGGMVSHAYVWYGDELGLGDSGTPANADWTATTDQHCNVACSDFGTRVGTAGDVNGDGYDDVFVGAPRYDNGQTDEGMVFVWYGGEFGLGDSGTPANADWKAESNQTNARLSGESQSYWTSGADTAGDVNGDGYDDLIVGAQWYDNGETDEGMAFLWLGSINGLNQDGSRPVGSPSNADWSVESNQLHAHLGVEVSSAGDFNKDGYDDVLVGVWLYDIVASTTLTNAGQIMIWYGSSEGLGADSTPEDADWIAHGDQVGGLLGFSVDSLGDVNKDGVSDVIAGAYSYDNPDANEGAAFAYHGAPPPIAGFSGTPNSGIAPLTVSFTNLSTGDFDTCSWDFGDGNSDTDCSDPSNEYIAGGVYTVSLTVSGPGGSTTEIKEGYITVYEPVFANFSALPTSGKAPLTVDFTNLSTGDFDICSWDFGDGNSDTDCSDPSNNYGSSGVYTVSLTISGQGGSATEIKESYITVYEPVFANFSAFPIIGKAPLTVDFTNLSTGDFDICLWDFGDGNTSDDCNDPSNEYTMSGVFTVSITVSGPGGSDIETKTEYITVEKYFSYIPVVLKPS